MAAKYSLLEKFPLDFRVCAVIFLGSGFLFMDSRGMADKAVLFPTIMLVAMMGLSLYCMVRSIIKQHAFLRTEADGTRTKPKQKGDLLAVCLFGFMTALYALFTMYIGFGLASLAFIGAGTIFFGEKDKRAIALIPLTTMIFVYGFFIYFLDVSIPFFPLVFDS